MSRPDKRIDPKPGRIMVCRPEAAATKSVGNADADQDLSKLRTQFLVPELVCGSFGSNSNQSFVCVHAKDMTKPAS